MIETALGGFAGAWFDAESIRAEWREFSNGKSDNSFFVWQWITPGLMREKRDRANAA